MKKTLLLAAIGLFLFACEKPNETTTVADPATETTEMDAMNETSNEVQETAKAEPNGTIYGCDDCFPGLRGSWYQVDVDWDAKKIHGIWYWDTENEDKKEMKILEQEFSEGEEISGFGGKFEFPSSGNVYDFGIVESNFNVSSGDDFYQYELEN